ncbi:MAG: hypothetical protein NT031_18765 [Planctomycetota bacterium]|nr:hypothetical protein [Planctomycetota bacterium]
MIVQPSVILSAFEMHYKRYGSGTKAWDIQYHVDCWQLAEQAFGGNAFDKFNKLYEELRRRWQVFRGASGPPWSADETFCRLNALPGPLRTLSLSQCSMDDASRLWRILEAVADIKKHKDGQPSTVAVSKFLDFWNNRLFVIVDHGVIWQKVFGHWWLWDEVEAVRAKVEAVLPGKRHNISDAGCDSLTYLAILLWAGEFLRTNPQIIPAFVEYVARHADSLELPLAQYEAAAVEWFLLGLVELAPQGVCLG